MMLRDYQIDALNRLRRGFAAGARRICLVAPTGAGKTTIAAELMRGAVAKGNRVLFLAHRTELIEQCAARLDTFGVDLGVIKNGTRRAKPSAPVQVASVQTLVNRRMPQARIVIVDECHRVHGDTYLKILANYAGSLVVGLTATPVRLDGKGLADVFDELVEAASVTDLIASGVLIRPKVYAPQTPDLEDVRMTAGDYNQRDLGAAMNTPRLVGGIVEHWQRLTPGRKTVVFASSVEHSQAIVASYLEAGVRAAHLDGTTPQGERQRILEDLASGAVTVVSNVAVLTEGWDCPTVEVVTLARPTKSMSMYLQMVGRGVRSAPGKEAAWVLDHAGCTHTHGLASVDREWSAWFEGRKNKPSAPGLKNCPECYAIVPSMVAICPECRYVWEAISDRQKRSLEAVEGELVEITATSKPHWLDRYRPKGAKPTAEEKETLWSFLKSVCERKGYAKGWASHQYREIMAVWPRFNDGDDWSTLENFSIDANLPDGTIKRIGPGTFSKKLIEASL